MFRKFSAHADSRILHHKPVARHPGGAAGGQLTYPELHTASFGGEFDGIAQNIQQNLVETKRVPENGFMADMVYICAEADSRILRLQRDDGGNLLH